MFSFRFRNQQPSIFSQLERQVFCKMRRNIFAVSWKKNVMATAQEI